MYLTKQNHAALNIVLKAGKQGGILRMKMTPEMVDAAAAHIGVLDNSDYGHAVWLSRGFKGSHSCAFSGGAPNGKRPQDLMALATQ
jgi:hypothetical protein